MTVPIGVVTQEPVIVGWVAALSVLIFMAVSYLVLVVAGRDGLLIRSVEEDRVEDGPTGAVTVLSAEPPIAAADGDAGGTFATSMASALRSMAVAVVERALLRPGERILDGGAGSVVAASSALLSGLTVLAVDPACGTLAIGRRVPGGASVAGADFAALNFATGWFNVVIAVHTLHFAADPVGVLKEWRRVTGPGGRLSISVPGPRSALGMRMYDAIYRRHEAGLQVHLPTRRTLAGWATSAGWREGRVFDDPEIVIRLNGPEPFRTWMETRPWSDPDLALSPEQLEALEKDLLAATTMGPHGQLIIPFGALYLTARNP